MGDENEITAQARKTRQLFKRVFASDDGKKALNLLKAHFETHLPSMIAMDCDSHKAAIMDGQKSVFLEIDDVIAGKYDTTPKE